MREESGQELVRHLAHLGETFKVFGVFVLLFILLFVALMWARYDDGTALAEENVTRQENALVEPAAESTVEPTTEPATGQAVTSTVGSAARSIITIPIPELTPLSGWKTIDGSRIYVERGVPISGERLLDGVIFNFDEQGRWISTRLDVPYISQLPDMPAGCEVTSVAMMLNYAGVPVTKEDLAAAMPYDSDPNLGFTGDLYSEGYYAGIIWPSALVDLVKSCKGTAVDLTGSSWDDLTRYLEQGKPVCIWLRNGGGDHTVVLSGYSDTSVWINDPLTEKDVALDLETFMAWWSSNEYHALSY